MLYSVIDIGSNTVKCQVYEVKNNNIEKRNFFTRQLGIIAKIKDGILPEIYISELTDTINEYISKVDSTVYCFATESLRKISNLDEVRSRIKEECNLELDLISGKDEALLSFSGFRANTPQITYGIMVDMGGGSTEIVRFTDGKPVELNSFKFGCLSLRRDFVKDRFPNKDEIYSIEKEVESQLNQYPWVNNSKRLCLIGGTGTAIGKLAAELGFITAPQFTSPVFMELFDYLSKPDDRITRLLEKHIPARIETIIPGMCAYRQIIKTINADTVFVSKAGIRDGYLYRKIRG